MEKHFFTFGSNQKDGAGNTLGGKYVEIAGDQRRSRLEMLSTRGAKWSMQYNEEEFEGQAEKYSLEKIELHNVYLNEDER